MRLTVGAVATATLLLFPSQGKAYQIQCIVNKSWYVSNVKWYKMSDFIFGTYTNGDPFAVLADPKVKPVLKKRISLGFQSCITDTDQHVAVVSVEPPVRKSFQHITKLSEFFYGSALKPAGLKIREEVVDFWKTLRGKRYEKQDISYEKNFLRSIDKYYTRLAKICHNPAQYEAVARTAQLRLKWLQGDLPTTEELELMPQDPEEVLMFYRLHSEWKRIDELRNAMGLEPLVEIWDRVPANLNYSNYIVLESETLKILGYPDQQLVENQIRLKIQTNQLQSILDERKYEISGKFSERVKSGDLPFEFANRLSDLSDLFGDRRIRACINALDDPNIIYTDVPPSVQNGKKLILIGTIFKPAIRYRKP